MDWLMLLPAAALGAAAYALAWWEAGETLRHLTRTPLPPRRRSDDCTSAAAGTDPKEPR